MGWQLNILNLWLSSYTKIYSYFSFTVVLSIRLDQASQSVIEGDVVTILITADRIAVENISIILQLTSLTTSGNERITMWT